MSRVIKFRAWSEKQKRFVVEQCTIGYLHQEPTDYQDEEFVSKPSAQDASVGNLSMRDRSLCAKIAKVP